MTVVRSPNAFRKTLGDAYVLTQFVDPPAEIRARVDDVIDAIFGDLQHFAVEDPELLPAYIEGLAEPLAELEALGLRLVAKRVSSELVAEGGPRDGGGPVAWTQTWYFVAPRRCYYRVDGHPLVHVLGQDCSGADDLIRDGAGLTWWGSIEALERTYAGDIPWCARCFRLVPGRPTGSAGAGSSGAPASGPGCGEHEHGSRSPRDA